MLRWVDAERLIRAAVHSGVSAAVAEQAIVVKLDQALRRLAIDG